MPKLVMVETLSQYRMRYVVEVEDNIDDALDAVLFNQSNFEFHEFSQKHLGPGPVVDHYEITKEEYLKMFNQDNDYLQSWDDDKKFAYINYMTDNYYSDERGADDGA